MNFNNSYEKLRKALNSDDAVVAEITEAIDELDDKNIQIASPLMIRAASKLASKAQLDQADNLYMKVKETDPEFEINPLNIINLASFFAQEKKYQGIHDFLICLHENQTMFFFRYGSNSSFTFS